MSLVPAPKNEKKFVETNKAIFSKKALPNKDEKESIGNSKIRYIKIYKMSKYYFYWK